VVIVVDEVALCVVQPVPCSRCEGLDHWSDGTVSTSAYVYDENYEMLIVGSEVHVVVGRPQVIELARWVTRWDKMLQGTLVIVFFFEDRRAR